MLLPWLLYFLRARRLNRYYFFLILFIFSRENYSILTVFLGLALALFGQREVRQHGLITLFIGQISSILIFEKIMPALTSSSYRYWNHYPALGGFPGRAALSVIAHPWRILAAMADNSQKLSSWFFIILSGGFAAILSPFYIILLLPVTMQKFLSTQEFQQGTQFHYSVELAPIIMLALIELLRRKKQKARRIIAAGALAINLILTLNVRLHDGTKITRILSPSYYSYSHSSGIRQILRLVPETVSVSAANTLVPHLTSRNLIYLFPAINNAEYVVLDTNNPKLLPLAELKPELSAALRQVHEPGKYDVMYASNGVELLKLKR